MRLSFLAFVHLGRIADCLERNQANKWPLMCIGCAL